MSEYLSVRSTPSGSLRVFEDSGLKKHGRPLARTVTDFESAGGRCTLSGSGTLADAPFRILDYDVVSPGIANIYIYIYRYFFFRLGPIRFRFERSFIVFVFVFVLFFSFQFALTV